MSTLSTSMAGPETSAAEQSRMELQAKLNGLGGINGRKLDPEAKAKKLREACEGFESIFIQKMWQEMRNAVPKTGLLTGREERFWQDMYDQELSKSMTKAGGIGLADMMYEQLSRNLVSASRSTSAPSLGQAFVPGAAPLVPHEMETLLPEPRQIAANIYDGEAAEAGGVAEKAPEQVAAPVAQATAPETAPERAAAAQGAIPPLQATATVATAAKPEEKAVEKAERKHPRKADLGQSSGLLQAQKARREAGDKLGARAVRPAQRGRKEEAVVEPEPAQPAPAQPGSPEALRAAVEQARTGQAATPNPAQPVNLNNLVASLQTMDLSQNGAPVESAEPATRKVRFSTNVPKQANTGNKKTKQAIRMLNVDSAGANSKQGRGLAAYHAQQEAMRPAAAQSQPVEPLKPETPTQAPIPPLTPQSQQASVENGGNYAIPPLTATGMTNG